MHTNLIVMRLHSSPHTKSFRCAQREKRRENWESRKESELHSSLLGTIPTLPMWDLHTPANSQLPAGPRSRKTSKKKMMFSNGLQSGNLNWDRILGQRKRCGLSQSSGEKAEIKDYVRQTSSWLIPQVHKMTHNNLNRNLHQESKINVCQSPSAHTQKSIWC